MAMLASGCEMPCNVEMGTPERVPRLGELRGDRHRLLDETDQRRSRQHSPFVKRPLVFRECLRAACQHRATLGAGRIDPRHRQLADVVDPGRAGVERQSDDVGLRRGR